MSLLLTAAVISEANKALDNHGDVFTIGVTAKPSGKVKWQAAAATDPKKFDCSAVAEYS